MTKEEKQLLLKDLCARLPYGVKYNYDGNEGCDYTMDRISQVAVDGAFPLEDIKPYLRPMSSMTEEEKADYHFYCETVWDSAEESYYHYDTPKSIDWQIAHHFDHRGLIPMGLALEAPEDMYKTK